MTAVAYIVQFSTGSARLTNSAKQGIKGAIQGLDMTKTILLDAYADPPGNRGLNSALTVVRAETVKSYVVGLGYPPHKILMRARGEGSYERPDLGDHSDAPRRVELLVLG